MLAPFKHDNRKLDHPVGLAVPILLGALCAPALATPQGGGEGYDPRYADIAWRADLSGNGTVDFADIQLFMAAWQNGAAGAAPGQADINLDGTITFTDLNILLAVFGMQVSPPGSGNGPLVPGDGFSGVTPQPVAVGVAGSPGYDAKAIARWDVVPYQEITGEFEVGVVAFHRMGISRVEFSLEGGPWLPVTEMTENERTGVWEYWTTVNTNELPDGPIEIRAIAYPNVGEPRVLEPLFLNANAHGSWGRGEVWVSSSLGNDASGNGTESSPFKTIWKAIQSFGSGANVDGLTVLLAEGEYLLSGMTSPFPVTADGWVTISAAPGADRDEVRIVGDPLSAANNRLRLGRYRLQNVMLDQRSGWDLASINGSMLWLDGVKARGAGPYSGKKAFHYPNWAAVYVTDTSIADYKDGCQGAAIARDVVLENLGSDAFSNSTLVINCSAERVHSNAALGYHADIYQFHSAGSMGSRDNVIVYGLRATDAWAQGIFAAQMGSISNVAFVNVLIERIVSDTAGPTDPMFSQWNVNQTNHLLLWHLTLVNQGFFWMNPTVRNLSVVGCSLQSINGAGQLLLVPVSRFESFGDWRSNHFVRSSGYSVYTPGVDVSVGDPGYLNAGGNDFRPGPSSPLRARLEAVCRPAADGHERLEVTSVGAFER